MKTIFFIGLAFFLFHSCERVELRSPNEPNFKKAVIDKETVTIWKQKGNGEYFAIEVPVRAAEAMAAASSNIPYSPIGSYVFYINYVTKDFEFDVFIYEFDGTNFYGSVGVPSGKTPYDLNLAFKASLGYNDNIDDFFGVVFDPLIANIEPPIKDPNAFKVYGRVDESGGITELYPPLTLVK